MTCIRTTVVIANPRRNEISLYLRYPPCMFSILISRLILYLSANYIMPQRALLSRINSKKKLCLSAELGGGRWIRTTEGIASRFTVCPLWPLGNSPMFNWSWWTDSNPRPADYKSAALPTELHQHSQGQQPSSSRPVIIAETPSFVNSFFHHFFKPSPSGSSGRIP